MIFSYSKRSALRYTLTLALLLVLLAPGLAASHPAGRTTTLPSTLAATSLFEDSSATIEQQEASAPVRIVIKDISLDRKLMPVGLDKNRVPIVPKHDIGWYTLSAMPGQGENVVLWGHVLRFKGTPRIPAPFARVKELQPGAIITIHTKSKQVFTYVVTDQIWVTPDQVEYILPQGEERLTLVSCIGSRVVRERGTKMSHRLITIAKPVP